MALPKIATPTFRTTIPSTGQEIEYRPFLVKEEKMLLMALEGQDGKEMTVATKKILDACIMTPDVDIDKLATFDVEYLFLQLRGKSISEVIELRVGHTDSVEGCDHKTDININIDDIKVEDVRKDNKIMITDQIGVVVRYPSMKDVLLLSTNADDKEVAFNVISSCIDMVFDAENVYDDFSHEEMKAWLDGLNQKQFEKVSSFFDKIPKLKYDVKWTCKKCKKQDHFVLEGLQSFFTYL